MRVKDLLELVGLDQRSMRRYPHSFSGGQRQRIGLARGAGAQPLRDPVRRADLGARRLRAGADPEPAEGPAERARALLPFRVPQPRRRRLHGQRDRRDVPGRHRRAGAARDACSVDRGTPTRRRCSPPCRAPTSTIRSNFEQVMRRRVLRSRRTGRRPFTIRAGPDRARPCRGRRPAISSAWPRRATRAAAHEGCVMTHRKA